jgi:SSS family solute:Na+ symporter
VALNKYGKTTGVFTSIAAYLYSTNTMEMMGIGFVLHLITGMPFFLGTLIGAVIVIIYTWTGGLWAVTMTDFIQFVAMMVTVGLAMIIGWQAVGGTAGVWEGLIEWTGSSEDALYFFRPGAGYLSPWTLVAYSVTALAVLCEPAFFQRMFAAASPKEIKRGFAIGVPMWLSFDWCVSFLGILGAAAIGLAIIPEVEPNEALFAIVGQYLPIGVMGIFVAGVLACAMSTADSYFLVAGGVIGVDLYRNIINPGAEDRKVERVTKIGMLVSAALSIGLAFLFERIMEVWVFQATLIVTTSLIPVYFGAFSKKPQKKAAGAWAAGFGLIASIGWYIWTNFFGVWSEDWEVYVIKLGSVELWQEYGILIITPIALIIYLIVNAVAKKTVEVK